MPTQSQYTLHQAIAHLQSLPPNAQAQAVDFIEFLFSKNHKTADVQAIQSPTKKRQAGSLAGQITLADDFDEPLEDFKDY